MQPKIKFKRSFLFILLVFIIFGVGFVAWLKKNPLDHVALDQEWLEFSYSVNEQAVVPFGYTLGAWPAYFQNEPIVMKMTYQKGPPTQFIQRIIQQWKPVDVEVTLEGPKTLKKDWTLQHWKKCFTEINFSCSRERRLFYEHANPSDQKSMPASSLVSTTVTWFDSLAPLGAKGVHFQLEYPQHWIERYAVITPQGAVQSFNIHYAKTPVGVEGRDLFVKTLGDLKVKDDLISSRAWIENKIRKINLDQIRAIPKLQERLFQLIQAQNSIFSLLSVNPTRIEPFFHLAGVTHLFTRELLMAKSRAFENQEAWIRNSKPLLEALVAYAKDFGGKKEIKNMEALLKDVLFMQQKISGGQSL